MERTVAAIAAMVDEAQRGGALAIAAVGTAGLRIASNSAAFVEAVEARCGVRIEVIPGEEEGRLAYLAATRSLGLAGGSLVVFDSGGGSSQFTFGRGGARRRAIQRQRRRSAIHRAVRPRRARLRGGAGGRARGDRCRSRAARRSSRAGRARRHGRRGDQPGGRHVTGSRPTIPRSFRAPSSTAPRSTARSSATAPRPPRSAAGSSGCSPSGPR